MCTAMQLSVVSNRQQTLTPVQAPFSPATFRVDIEVTAAFSHGESNITRHFDSCGIITDATDFLLSKRASFLILNSHQ
ncbi:Uncharacterised protein [Pantoea agglomerans]|uniref:Uncharacterized protein n=1 Tax=Enterobacter agglomerans TaxID=549 RepID=A0A379LUX2_ENTAG|nr:Uncharacterised protein [Pantoea agglomerans]